MAAIDMVLFFRAQFISQAGADEYHKQLRGGTQTRILIYVGVSQFLLSCTIIQDIVQYRLSVELHGKDDMMS